LAAYDWVVTNYGPVRESDDQGVPPVVPFAAPGLQDALTGRYDLERELGHGGMATVYLARDVKHDRPVALKVLHPDLGAALGPERFRREITTAARLQHPHVLTVYDSGESAGRLWFTMPFVDGESLRDRLTRERQLPVGDAVRIAYQVAQALHYAHTHGIVHRDVKPENILLTEDGNTLVADFGIARALQSGSEGTDGDKTLATRLTGTGLALGTPAYMSPEQSAGERNVDARTDVYALGAVLFEMLAGEPPFSGATPQVVIAKRLSTTAPSVRVARPTVSPALEAVVARALATAPADRFQSASDFAQALEAASTGATPVSETGGSVVSERTTASSTPAAFTVPASPRTRRTRRTALVWLVIPALVLIGGALTFWWHRRSGAASAVATAAATATGPTRLAVLPFDNVGRPEDAYVVDGITDEIREKLASIPGLQVIARASSNQYRGTTKPPQQIAHELGATYLLTGTVQFEPGADGHPARVRVTPELAQVGANTAPVSRWTRSLDAQVQDVFAMQADIAGRVASAMDIALGSATEAKLAEAPTKNPAAYDAYLRGLAATGGGASSEPAALRRALEYFRQAVQLDSGFADAWSSWASTASLLYVNGVPTPALAEEGRSAAERARALAPDAAATARALGNYYMRVARDYRKALAVLAHARQLAPDDAGLLANEGNVERYLGQGDAAVRDLRAAAQLDPRSAPTARVLAEALLWARQYPEARQAADRYLALTPPATSANAIEYRVMVELGSGDLAAARRVIAPAPAGLAPKELNRDALLVVMANYWDLYWVLGAADQQRLLQLPVSAFDGDRGAWGIVRAETYWVRGDTVHARVYADSARQAFQAQLQQAPNDPQRTALLGLALAYLGRSAEAVQKGERAVALDPISRDGIQGPYLQHVLARIYLLSGQREKALDALAPLLKIPYYLSPGWLRIDPTFNTLHGNPRFQQLIAGR
jgi:eukaryotic-like serine/threonine-protein kinase